MRITGKRSFRGFLLTGMYLLGIIGILASGGGGGGGGGAGSGRDGGNGGSGYVKIEWTGFLNKEEYNK